MTTLLSLAGLTALAGMACGALQGLAEATGLKRPAARKGAPTVSRETYRAEMARIR